MSSYQGHRGNVRVTNEKKRERGDLWAWGKNQQGRQFLEVILATNVFPKVIIKKIFTAMISSLLIINMQKKQIYNLVSMPRD